MLSSQNVAIVKIPFRLKVTPFLIIAIVLVLMGMGIFNCNSGILHAWGPINFTLCHEKTISGGEMYTPIIHLWLTLWLLIQWMVYRIN